MRCLIVGACVKIPLLNKVNKMSKRKTLNMTESVTKLKGQGMS